MSLSLSNVACGTYTAPPSLPPPSPPPCGTGDGTSPPQTLLIGTAGQSCTEACAAEGMVCEQPRDWALTQSCIADLFGLAAGQRRLARSDCMRTMPLCPPGATLRVFDAA